MITKSLAIWSVCLAMPLILITGCGGGASTPINTTVTTPVPILNSVSPAAIGVGAPDTTIVVTGTNFVSASKVTLNGAALSTQFVSATQLSAVISAGDLKAVGTAQVTVSNPAPGGGSSAAQTLSILAIGTVSLFSIPAQSGNTAGPWQLIVSVVDPPGGLISNLSVTLNASSGTLGLSQGITDSSGSFSTTITPPTDAGAGSASAISALVGDRIATVNLSFASFGPAASVHNKQTINHQQSGSPSFTQEPFGLAISTQPSDPSNPLILKPDPCYTPLDLTTADSTAACAPLYSSNNIIVNVSNAVNETCQLVSVASTIVGVANCVGTTAIASVCLATPALEIICAGNLSRILTSEPVLGCATFIAGLIAQHFQNQTAIQIVDAIGIVTDPRSKLGWAGVVCDALQATSSSGPRVYVANAGTVSVFNEDGQPIQTQASFSGLINPDGVAYDAATQQLYITDVGDNTIKVYTLQGQRVDVGTAFPTNPGGNPEDIVFDPFNRHFYVNDTTFNSVLVYSEMGAPVPLSNGAFSGLSQPFGIGFNHVTSLIYIANSDVNQVLVFDEDGNSQPQGPFAGLSLPDDISWDPATGDIYIANDGDSSVKVYDPNGVAVPTPGGFQGLVLPDQVTGDGNFLSPKFYVSSIEGNSLRVFDRHGSDLTPVNGFQHLNQPTGVVVVP